MTIESCSVAEECSGATLANHKARLCHEQPGQIIMIIAPLLWTKTQQTFWTHLRKCDCRAASTFFDIVW